MLHELAENEFERVRPVFGGYLEDPLMYAVLEGRRPGRVFVDRSDTPQAGFVWTNSECAYVAGGEEDSEFQHALRRLVLEEIVPALEAAGRDFLSLFSFPSSYAKKLEKLFGNQVPLKTALNTFSFKRETYDARRSCLYSLPAGLTLKGIDAQVLGVPEHEYLAEEVAFYWGSVDNFVGEGLGYCVLEEGRMVSWCYVQAYGCGAQTIDVWTDQGYRQRGLGAIAASAVIDHSLSRGYEPFWICDEANVASRRLAERVGFEYVGDIELVDIPFRPHDFYQGLANHFFFPHGRYREAAESYERAFQVQDGEAQDHYQAAVGWAKVGEMDKAMVNVERAIARGWRDVEALEKEEAFARLRELKSWQDLISQTRGS